MDIYPAILEAVRKNSESIPASLPSCCELTKTGDRLGLWILSPNHNDWIVKVLVYFQECLHCPDLLDNDGWVEENLNLDHPLTLTEIVERYIQGVDFDYAQTFYVERLELEKKAVVQYYGKEMTVQYQTAAEILDDIEHLLAVNHFTLTVPTSYIK